MGEGDHTKAPRDTPLTHPLCWTTELPSPNLKSGLPDFGRSFTRRKSDISDFRWGEGTLQAPFSDAVVLALRASAREARRNLLEALVGGIRQSASRRAVAERRRVPGALAIPPYT